MRYTRGQAQLNKIIQDSIHLGNLDYQSLRFQRAIYHWEKALNLLRDKDSDTYLQTLKKIAIAEKRSR